MPEHGWTTIRLTKVGDRWTATQRGVAVTGTGETPQWAAADYCEKVAERVEDPQDQSHAPAKTSTLTEPPQSIK